MNLSLEARIVIGIMLITLPTIEAGGAFLLSRLKKHSGYSENGVQGHFFRAGHAHAGVLLILGMFAQVLVDAVSIATPLQYAVRLGFMLPPILIPLGFFLGAPDASGKPRAILRSIYVGAFSLAVSAILLGAALIFNG